MKTLILIPTLSLLIFGCVTVPTDAPQLLHDASASVKKADQMGASKHLPKTMKTAKSDLDESIRLYILGNAENIERSITKAKSALDASKNAVILTEKMKFYDRDISNFKKENRQIKSLNLKTSHLAKENKKLKNIDQFGGAISYFDKGSTQIDAKYLDRLDQLVNLLRIRPELNISLQGYSDAGGSEEKNKELSKLRAENISQNLQSRGIEAGRIVVEQGLIDELATGRGARRVDLEILSH